MKITILLFAVSVICTSCVKDDFRSVTKIIEAPSQIELDNPFVFSLKLINNTDSELPLTLDNQVQKSLQFIPIWYCGDEIIVSHTIGSRVVEDNDYSHIRLLPGDSLIYYFKAELVTYSDKDSITFIIEDYPLEYIFPVTKCVDFKMIFRGMWIPGNGPFADSMEGYGFRKEIEIKTTANTR